MSCRRKCLPPQLPAAIRCSRLRERPGERDFMDRTTQQRNKDIVLEAFDTLFNKRDYAKAETFWSPKYIQHSAHIEPGREGLFNLIKSIPATLKYEPGLIVAEGDFCNPPRTIRWYGSAGELDCDWKIGVSSRVTRWLECRI